jgi:hypothetical protein
MTSRSSGGTGSGCPTTRIAAALGVSQPAVVKAAERGRTLLAKMRWEPSLK